MDARKSAEALSAARALVAQSARSLDEARASAAALAEKAHASGEDIVVVARFGGASAPSEERVTIRKAGGVVHAIRSGDPGAAVIPPADFDKIVGQLKALAEGK